MTMDIDLPAVIQLLERYQTGIALFEEAVRNLPPGHFDSSPAPGKWTARQIICHVADSEAIAAVRYRMIAAQPGSALTAFDQEKWARELLYSETPWEEALSAFGALRRHNLNMLRGLPLEAWSRSAIHEERGENTLFRMVKHNAEHAENHAGQVRNIAGRFAGAATD